MSPEEYLKSIGIEPGKFVFIAYVEGSMRQPNILEIMKGYAATVAVSAS